MSVLYEELTPSEFKERIGKCPVAYLPLGTLEYHGPHLPLGTDLLQGRALFTRAAEMFGGIVMPGITVGIDRYYKDDWKELYGMDLYLDNIGTYRPYAMQQFPGSAYWVPEETYDLIIDSMIKQLARAGFKAVMGCGHGPNTSYFVSMAPRMKEKYGVTLLAPDMNDPEVLFIFDHASKCETSNMMYFYPELVHMEKFPEDMNDYPDGLCGANPRTEASAEFAGERVKIILDRIGKLISDALN